MYKKNKLWIVNEKVTNTIQVNIMEVTNITWRHLMQATIHYLKNQAFVDEIYIILIKSKKAENNNHIREKIRQTLNTNPNF